MRISPVLTLAFALYLELAAARKRADRPPDQDPQDHGQQGPAEGPQPEQDAWNRIIAQLPDFRARRNRALGLNQPPDQPAQPVTHLPPPELPPPHQQHHVVEDPDARGQPPAHPPPATLPHPGPPTLADNQIRFIVPGQSWQATEQQQQHGAQQRPPHPPSPPPGERPRRGRRRRVTEDRRTAAEGQRQPAEHLDLPPHDDTRSRARHATPERSVGSKRGRASREAARDRQRRSQDGSPLETAEPEGPDTPRARGREERTHGSPGPLPPPTAPPSTPGPSGARSRPPSTDPFRGHRGDIFAHTMRRERTAARPPPPPPAGQGAVGHLLSHVLSTSQLARPQHAGGVVQLLARHRQPAAQPPPGGAGEDPEQADLVRRMHADLSRYVPGSAEHEAAQGRWREELGRLLERRPELRP